MAQRIEIKGILKDEALKPALMTGVKAFLHNLEINYDHQAGGPDGRSCIILSIVSQEGEEK